MTVAMSVQLDTACCCYESYYLIDWSLDDINSRQLGGVRVRIQEQHISRGTKNPSSGPQPRPQPQTVYRTSINFFTTHCELDNGVLSLPAWHRRAKPQKKVVQPKEREKERPRRKQRAERSRLHSSSTLDISWYVLICDKTENTSLTDG